MTPHPAGRHTWPYRRANVSSALVGVWRREESGTWAARRMAPDAPTGVIAGASRRTASVTPPDHLRHEEDYMTTARDIMNAGATCVSEGQSLLEAARMMRDLGVGSLPICGNDQKLHGIITDRDIVIKCIAEGKDVATCTAGELAQGEITWVDSKTDISEVVDLMGRKQVKRLPVIDDHQLVGMISEADLARHLDEHQLSEFVEKVFARP